MKVKEKHICFLVLKYIATQKSNIKSIHEGVKFPCNECDYKATKKVNLISHIKSVHQGIKYPCDECDYKATKTENLMSHKRSIHEKIKHHCINVTIWQQKEV